MPALTATDTAVRARLRLVLLRLARRIRQEAGAGVTPSQLSALSSINYLGPVRLGSLAEHERISKPSVTRIVAALEETGYVERRRDSDDGRSFLVAVTPAGARVLEQSRDRADAYLARQLAALAPEDRAAVERSVPILEKLLEVEA
jgi:DNA-binding MarR family transcriptional regulator